MGQCVNTYIHDVVFIHIHVCFQSRYCPNSMYASVWYFLFYESHWYVLCTYFQSLMYMCIHSVYNTLFKIYMGAYSFVHYNMYWYVLVLGIRGCHGNPFNPLHSISPLSYSL